MGTGHGAARSAQGQADTGTRAAACAPTARGCLGGCLGGAAHPRKALSTRQGRRSEPRSSRSEEGGGLGDRMGAGGISARARHASGCKEPPEAQGPRHAPGTPGHTCERRSALRPGLLRARPSENLTGERRSAREGSSQLGSPRVFHAAGPGPERARLPEAGCPAPSGPGLWGLQEGAAAPPRRQALLVPVLRPVHSGGWAPQGSLAPQTLLLAGRRSRGSGVACEGRPAHGLGSGPPPLPGVTLSLLPRPGPPRGATPAPRHCSTVQTIMAKPGWPVPAVSPCPSRENLPPRGAGASRWPCVGAARF